MEEPNTLTSHGNGRKEDKKKVAVGFSYGGGIGVGLVFIGGALAAATVLSALTVVGRKLLKSRNNKNRNHCHSDKTLEKFIAEDITTSTIKDEIEGLQPFPPDMDQNLSNGTVKTSVTETDANGMISSKSFFTEEKQNLQLYSGKGDLIYDDKEIFPTSGLHGSDANRQRDGYGVETQEFSLPVVEDQTHFQPANMNEDLYGGEIEIIEEESISKIPDVDHFPEEDGQLMQVSNGKKVSEGKCKDADQSALITTQSSEEQESTLIDHDQDSSNRGCLPSKFSMSVETDISVSPLYSSSLCKSENLEINCEELSHAFDTVETLEGAEAVKAVHVDKGHGNSLMLMMEEKEKNCNQHEVWLITESAEQQKRDEILEAAHADQDKVNGAILMFEEEKICSQHDGSLIFQTVGVLKSHEKVNPDEGNRGLLIVPTVEVLERDVNLDADTADGSYISTVITTGETGQKYDQHVLTVENARGLEEDKAIEPAQGKAKTEILILEKETGHPHDDENDAADNSETLAVALDSVSSYDLPKQLTEEEENPPTDSQEDHFVSDMKTFEEVQRESSAARDPDLYLRSAQDDLSQFERGDGFRCNFTEIELLVEASETREENVSSEPVREESEDSAIESDTNPLKQSIGNAFEENKEASTTTEADSVGVTGQMTMNEEDSMDDDTDEASITDKVDENSEGTGDSSAAEYNTEPIWPAESLEELSVDSTGLKFHDQIENQQPDEENKTLQTEAQLHSNDVEDRGNSVKSLQNINEGKENILEQNDQQTNSLKPRFLDLKWAFMVLFWSCCFWCHGLPYFKISLMAILVILLSKIQGT